MMRLLRLWASWALAAAATACSPAVDWRELRPEGAHVSAQMPCRPASHERTMALAGSPVSLRLYACRSGETLFALAYADLGDPGRVGAALAALGESSRSNLQAQVEQVAPAVVPGMTPHAAAQQWRLRGHLPDGRAVSSLVTVFAYGTRVYQATLVGPVLDESQLRPFLNGLAVRP